MECGDLWLALVQHKDSGILMWYMWSSSLPTILPYSEREWVQEDSPLPHF